MKIFFSQRESEIKCMFLNLYRKNTWIKPVGVEEITGLSESDGKKDEAQICLYKQ